MIQQRSNHIADIPLFACASPAFTEWHSTLKAKTVAPHFTMPTTMASRSQIVSRSNRGLDQSHHPISKLRKQRFSITQLMYSDPPLLPAGCISWRSALRRIYRQSSLRTSIKGGGRRPDEPQPPLPCSLSSSHFFSPLVGFYILHPHSLLFVVFY